MATTTPLAKIPVPEPVDRTDGPGAFSNMAKRLEDITVIPYTSAVARNNAYTGITPARMPLEGTVSYLMDTNAFEFHDGANWVPILPNNWAKGILAMATGTVNPAVIPYNTERILPDNTLLNVPLAINRIYRVTAVIPYMDGQAGSSPTGGGAAVRIRWVAGAAAPITTSSALIDARCPILGDSTNLASGITTSRTFLMTSTANYSIGLFVTPYAAKGAVPGGYRQLILEDLGMMK
jgi:hypothetical protein